MGLFKFLRDVGAKLTGHGGAYSAPTPEALQDELKRLGLPADGVSMTVEGDTVHLSGQVPDPETVAERLRGGGYRALLLTH